MGKPTNRKRRLSESLIENSGFHNASAESEDLRGEGDSGLGIELVDLTLDSSDIEDTENERPNTQSGQQYIPENSNNVHLEEEVIIDTSSGGETDFEDVSPMQVRIMDFSDWRKPNECGTASGQNHKADRQNSQENRKLEQCPFCDKTYYSATFLISHVNDEERNCYKTVKGLFDANRNKCLKCGTDKFDSTSTSSKLNSLLSHVSDCQGTLHLTSKSQKTLITPEKADVPIVVVNVVSPPPPAVVNNSQVESENQNTRMVSNNSSPDENSNNRRMTSMPPPPPPPPRTPIRERKTVAEPPPANINEKTHPSIEETIEKQHLDTPVNRFKLNERISHCQPSEIIFRPINFRGEEIPSQFQLAYRCRHCNQCGDQEFSAIKEGLLHLEESHQDKRCPRCFERVSILNDKFNDHIKKHFVKSVGAEGNIVCVYCGQKFHFEQMWDHMEEKHLRKFGKNVSTNGSQTESAVSELPVPQRKETLVPSEFRIPLPPSSVAESEAESCISHGVGAKCDLCKENESPPPQEVVIGPIKHSFNQKMTEKLVKEFLKNPNAPWDRRVKKLERRLGCKPEKIRKWFAGTRSTMINGGMPFWTRDEDKNPIYDWTLKDKVLTITRIPVSDDEDNNADTPSPRSTKEKPTNSKDIRTTSNSKIRDCQGADDEEPVVILDSRYSKRSNRSCSTDTISSETPLLGENAKQDSKRDQSKFNSSNAETKNSSSTSTGRKGHRSDRRSRHTEKSKGDAHKDDSKENRKRKEESQHVKDMSSQKQKSNHATEHRNELKNSTRAKPSVHISKSNDDAKNSERRKEKSDKDEKKYHKSREHSKATQLSSKNSHGEGSGGKGRTLEKKDKTGKSGEIIDKSERNLQSSSTQSDNGSSKNRNTKHPESLERKRDKQSSSERIKTSKETNSENSNSKSKEKGISKSVSNGKLKDSTEKRNCEKSRKEYNEKDISGGHRKESKEKIGNKVGKEPEKRGSSVNIRNYRQHEDTSVRRNEILTKNRKSVTMDTVCNNKNNSNALPDSVTAKKRQSDTVPTARPEKIRIISNDNHKKNNHGETKEDSRKDSRKPEAVTKNGIRKEPLQQSSIKNSNIHKNKPTVSSTQSKPVTSEFPQHKSQRDLTSQSSNAKTSNTPANTNHQSSISENLNDGHVMAKPIPRVSIIPPTNKRDIIRRDSNIENSTQGVPYVDPRPLHPQSRRIFQKEGRDQQLRQILKSKFAPNLQSHRRKRTRGKKQHLVPSEKVQQLKELQQQRQQKIDAERKKVEMENELLKREELKQQRQKEFDIKQRVETQKLWNKFRK